MRPRRVALLVVGLATAALGATILLVPSVGRRVDSAFVRVALILLGALGVAAAGWSLTRSPEGTAVEPTPERRPPYWRPAGEVATLLEGAWHRRESGATETAVRETLRDLAVETLARERNGDRDAAAMALDDGSWTDDDLAAAFFTDSGASVRDVLRSLAVGEPAAARRARHVAAELARLRAGAAATPARRPPATPPDDRSEYWPSTVDRVTTRGRLVVAGSLLAATLGVLGGRPALVLLGVLGLAVTMAGRAFASPEPTVRVDRECTPTTTAPGDRVTVRLIVENVGDDPLFDLRVVDGVPPGLVVTDGSPRLATALRPGRSASVSYELTAVPGRHAFDQPVAVVRDATGTRRCERTVPAPETTLTCGFGRLALDDVASAVGQVPGVTSAGSPGPGVEFHSVREYRPGDPIGSVDWRRFARSGELASVRFREERLSPVVVVVDARASAYVAPPDSDVPAVHRGVRAAYGVAAGLLEGTGAVPVGLAGLSPDPCWLPPGTGAGHLDRIRAALLGHPAFGWEPPKAAAPSLDRVARLLPPDAHAILVSPLADDGAVDAARQLLARTMACTVLSPSVADPTRPDEGYAYLQRQRRLETLRAAGARVVDWPWNRRLAEVVPGGD